MVQTAQDAVTYHKDSHCTYCGFPYDTGNGWPRQCRRCQNLTFKNPIPVTVVLIPVDAGVLVIRRAIYPHRGKYALPGGFIESGETWQEAGAREVEEEAGLSIDPHDLREVRVFSATDNTLIVCAYAPALRSIELPPFHPTPEASARIVLTQPIPLAFPLHTELVANHLAHLNGPPSTSASRMGYE